MKNEERMKNEVEVDHGRDSAVLWLHCLFFLLLFSSFSQFLHLWTLKPLAQPPFTPIYSKTRHLGWRYSPRRAVTSFWSNLAYAGELVTSPWSYFGGPDEPEACLGEPGVWKSFQMTLLPSLLGIFCVFLNVKKPFRLHSSWCQVAQFS